MSDKLKLFHIVLRDYHGHRTNYLVTAETKKDALHNLLIRGSTYWDDIVQVSICAPYNLESVNKSTFLRQLA